MQKDVSQLFDNFTKITPETRYKILSPIQMLQRLPIALTQEQAGNPSEDLLNEV